MVSKYLKKLIYQGLEACFSCSSLHNQCYPKGIPTKFKFNWSDIEKTIKGYKMPIVAGIGVHGELVAYDMVKENRANLIIIGEPGAGKSTQLRQILTTWIKHVGADRLKMYLADLIKK